MNTCVLDGIQFLVPDKYVEKIKSRLGSDFKIRILDDVSPFKSCKTVDLLIDDPRYTVRFMAKNLDFIQDDAFLPLLSATEDLIGSLDHSFNSLIKGSGIDYRVYNLQEGTPIFREKLNYSVVICGLGDVGGTLLSGLRLLGDETISEILIYDRNETKVQRWYREVSQILRPDGSYMPPLRIITKEELFRGDVFIFCVSGGVPELGRESGEDVRMVQLKQNAQILKEYVELADAADYRGGFFIVSDPVDQLCMFAYRHGHLRSQQIRGFGLGVMYARAVFHANEKKLKTDELRVYGPHGQGLQVLNSNGEYDEAVSAELTELTKTENIRIRQTGFKPYIAPAMSSGAISILACLKGDWHYSSTLLNGVWFGTRNRQLGLYVEYEILPLQESFARKLIQTQHDLAESMNIFDTEAQ